MIEVPETHQIGHCSVENADLIERLDLQDCDFGLQVSEDGRVWVCVNGIAWIRFKPRREVSNNVANSTDM